MYLALIMVVQAVANMSSQLTTVIEENFLNLPWIDEVNSDFTFQGWSMEGRDNEVFIDVVINMEHAKEARAWYDNLSLDTLAEDENGDNISISYDESEEVAEMRNDDTDDPDYEWPEDMISFIIHSQTHLELFAEACKNVRNEK